MTLPKPSAERQRALRRMKRNATGLLLAAAVVFVVCVTVGDGHGVWGYVEAAAEASMVGGLADWFAVTALFRHPLRLPIPHTAIIPAKKDRLAEELSTAVGGLAGVLRDDELRNSVAAFADKRLRELDIAPLLARLIDAV